MHFPRNIFIRKTEDETRLSPEWPKSGGSSKSPKSPKSPKTPKSPKSPRSPKPLTYTRPNNEYLDQCLGCDNVADLIQWNVAYGTTSEGRLSPVLLHDTFEELESCAQRCQICRVFRQSLLLEEVTFEGVEALKAMRDNVVVRWTDAATTDSASSPYLTVEIQGRPERAGVVNCNVKSDIGHLALRVDPRDPIVMDQARQWLEGCLHDHIGDCDNLSFSKETPDMLIEVLTPDVIRLCEVQEAQYVALSYCWGAPNDEVEEGKTTDKNVKKRHEEFSTKTLPATIRDALYVVHAMGIRYAWIDSLCINQTTSIGVATMHKVYSNALFTICACATTKATGKMLDRREAWTLRTEPCQLGGRWLTTSDMCLSELRLRSPLAGRAWTLQEERLSPRMLYISSSRMYWSCAKGCKVEVLPTYGDLVSKVQRPVHAQLDRKVGMPPSQDFLMACYDPERDLHTFWADIVKSYALRNMGQLGDRLNALSGLAARYLSASDANEYLAGIWESHLPEGLAWKVQRAVRADQEISSQWPSWSWTVLPLQTAIETKPTMARSSFFRRENVTLDSRKHGDVEHIIKRGVELKEVYVRGRVRELWKPSSRLVDWSSVSKAVQGEERFTFGADPAQSVHAIQMERGRVLVYEDRQKEVVCQLDFQHDVSRAASCSKWVALEIGLTTMLLLEPCKEGPYRRIGVAWDIRKNYFACAEETVLVLR